MKISKVVRRTGQGAAASLNAVVAANVGETGSGTTAVSHQDVQIVQRAGRTELNARDTDCDED